MRKTGGGEAQSAFLRVVVVGPSHLSTSPTSPTSPISPISPASPAAQHTADLAAMLRDAGHEVTLVTWHHQPLTPGEGSGRRHPGALGRSALGWARPDSWWRSGRRLRGADVVVLVHAGLRSLPALAALLRGMGLAALGPAEAPPVVLVAEDSLAHAPHTAAHRLTAALVDRCDAVLAHDAAGADVARSLGAARVSVTPRPRAAALAAAPAGSAAPPGLQPPPAVSAERAPAVVRPGPAAPGRRPGAPGPVPGGHAVVLPVSVPPFPAPVRADVAGVPGGVAAPRPTAQAGVAGGAGRGASAMSVEDDEPVLPADWARYVGAIEALAAATPPAAPGLDGEAAGPSARAPRGAVGAAVARTTRGVAARLGTVRARRRSRRPLVPLGRADLPDWVVPTDVLLDADEAGEARRVAVDLGLPRVGDATAAWAALGALAAVVRLVDDGHRSAVVVHETGVGDDDHVTRGAPFPRWARSAGFAPVGLGLTDPAASVADLDVDLESLDAIVRVHPDGCDADDVDEAVGQAGWALRHGGVLVVTVPLAPRGVAGAVAAADLRGIVARARRRRPDPRRGPRR